MSELKTYVCPNCGANTTNTQNCEYCGSLLVRFVEKGIDLSQTSYTNNDAIFPGLIEELRRNLKLQEENPNIGVATDLFKVKDNGECECINIMNGFSWGDNTVSPEFNVGKKQFCIAMNFSTLTDVDSYKEYNDKQDAYLAKFRLLDSFPLFTPHNCTFVDEWGKSRYGREYAINFGTDVEGAARLVSEILIKIQGWSLTEPFDILTNVGNNVDRARSEWFEAHGFGSTQQSFADNSGCMVLIGAFIVTVGSILCGCFA